MNVVSQLLGKYYANFYIGGFEILTLTVYLVVLAWKKEKRRFFGFRLGMAVIAQIAVSVLMSVIRTDYDTLAIRILFDCMTLAVLLGTVFFCYREELNEMLLCFASTVVVKNFSGTIIPLMRNMLGYSDLESVSFFHDFIPARDWPIYYGIQVTFLAVICYFFQKGEQDREETLDMPGAMLLTVAVVLLRGVMHPISRYYQPLSFELSVCVKVLFLIIYVLIIAIRAGLLSRRRILSDLRATQMLLFQEQKRYEEMRDNIEVINMKCHDINRQLSNLQGKLTENELLALREAINIYDSNIKTGNEIVDTVLYQKQLFCEKHKIRLSHMVDGSLLTFIEPSRLYALLTNALENAIEAVLKVPDEKRLISLTVSKKQAYAAIEVTNFYNADASISSGTSKDDKVHHGFGLKSMRYIIEEYHGTLETDTDDQLFYLTATIPMESNTH